MYGPLRRISAVRGAIHNLPVSTRWFHQGGAACPHRRPVRPGFLAHVHIPHLSAPEALPQTESSKTNHKVSAEHISISVAFVHVLLQINQLQNSVDGAYLRGECCKSIGLICITSLSDAFHFLVAGPRSPRMDDLLGQYTRVLRGLRHIQFHGVHPGGTFHGNGSLGGDE